VRSFCSALAAALLFASASCAYAGVSFVAQAAAYVPGPSPAAPDILVINSAGMTRTLHTMGLANNGAEPDISPDGTKLVFLGHVPNDASDSVVVMDTDGNVIANVPFQPKYAFDSTGRKIRTLRGYESLEGGERLTPAWVTNTRFEAFGNCDPDHDLVVVYDLLSSAEKITLSADQVAIGVREANNSIQGNWFPETDDFTALAESFVFSTSGDHYAFFDGMPHFGSPDDRAKFYIDNAAMDPAAGKNYEVLAGPAWSGNRVALLISGASPKSISVAFADVPAKVTTESVRFVLKTIQARDSLPLGMFWASPSKLDVIGGSLGQNGAITVVEQAFQLLAGPSGISEAQSISPGAAVDPDVQAVRAKLALPVITKLQELGLYRKATVRCPGCGDAVGTHRFASPLPAEPPSADDLER